MGTSLAKEGKLGHRITKSMNVKFGYDDLELLRHGGYAAAETNLPLGNVYVYCAPCACAVRTALTICAYGSLQYLQYITRVDDRISASCCPESTKMDRLISLVATIKEIEATEALQMTGVNTRWIEYIDRVWIEQRVYRLEEEFYAQSFSRSTVVNGQELFAEFQSESKETGVVFLGELDHCLWMLQTQPFPWKARIPKETEIYKLAKTTADSGWERIYLGTYTPRKFKAYTSYPTSPSFLDLPIKGTTTDSVQMRSESKLSLENTNNQNFTEKDREDFGEIQNRQLTTNKASSTSQNDLEDEAQPNLPSL